MVSKNLVTWTETVAVDESEILALPETVREALKKVDGITPKVLVMNPGTTATYGAFSHAEMESKKWNDIFGTVKTAIATAKRDGSFLASATLRKIADTDVEKWTSSAGSVLEAKLVGVDGEVFVFETKDGKTIRAGADKLSAESAKRAKELAKE